jgi:tRNA (mo5U34)-methyltransferase
MAAIEIRRRGAKRVVAIDSDDRYPSLVRFAVETCAADIEFHRLSLFPAAALRERLDLVHFMGVLDHLRHPLLALDVIGEHVVADILVLQSTLRDSDNAASLQQDYDLWRAAHCDAPGDPRRKRRALRRGSSSMRPRQRLPVAELSHA